MSGLKNRFGLVGDFKSPFRNCCDALCRQQIHRFIQAFAGDDLNIIPVVEVGHDLKSNIQFWIWNNPDDFGYTALVAGIHEIPDVRRAGNVHRLEISHIDQKSKPRGKLCDRDADVLNALSRLIWADAAAVYDRHAILRLIQVDVEHGAGKELEG